MRTGEWIKSTRSGANGCCVEVKFDGSTVLVRDTKAAGTGAELSFNRAEWDAFVGGAKDGEFDLV